MKVTESIITGSPPVTAGAGGGAPAVPEWLNQAAEIVKGIRELWEDYKQTNGMTGQNPPRGSPEPAPAPKSIYEARAAKKAEMAGREIPPERTIINVNQNDEIKEFVEKSIKFFATLEQIGFGEKTIGEAIMSAPFKVNQVKGALIHYYKSKYGGEK